MDDRAAAQPGRTDDKRTSSTKSMTARGMPVDDLKRITPPTSFHTVSRQRGAPQAVHSWMPTDLPVHPGEPLIAQAACRPAATHARRVRGPRGAYRIRI